MNHERTEELQNTDAKSWDDIHMNNIVGALRAVSDNGFSIEFAIGRNKESYIVIVRGVGVQEMFLSTTVLGCANMLWDVVAAFGQQHIEDEPSPA